MREYRQTFTPELTTWFWNLFFVPPVQAMTWSSTVVLRSVNNVISVETRNAVAVRSFETMLTLGYLPEVKQQIVEMAVNGSGIRDTARVLKISPTTVIEEGSVLDLWECENTVE